MDFVWWASKFWGNLRFTIGLIPKTFWVISTFLIHQFFFRGLKQGKKGSKRVLVFMFQNINYAKNHKQESKKNTKTDMIQINISNKITFLNYWNSTISNKILATKPQLWFWNVIRNDLRTTEIYIYKTTNSKITFFLAFLNPIQTTPRCAMLWMPCSRDPNKVNVSLGGGRGSKRGSCVKKIQAFSFLNKWNQIGVFFAWGVFLGRNGSCFSFPPAVWFLLGMGSMGTCSEGKNQQKTVYLENGSL